MTRGTAASIVFLLGTTPACAATLGTLTLHPPAPWKRLGNPPQVRGGTSLAWNTLGGKELHVDFWPGLPPQDGGVMVVAQKHALNVAGQKVELIKTSFFMGQKAEVWVTSLRRGPAWYRIFARHTSRADFETVLQTVRFGK